MFCVWCCLCVKSVCTPDVPVFFLTQRFPPKCRVFVANLATKVSPQDLRNIFEKHGPLGEDPVIVKNFGFVQYLSEGCAQKAIEKENGTLVAGQKIATSLSDNRPAKKSSFPSFLSGDKRPADEAFGDPPPHWRRGPDMGEMPGFGGPLDMPPNARPFPLDDSGPGGYEPFFRRGAAAAAGTDPPFRRDAVPPFPRLMADEPPPLRLLRRHNEPPPAAARIQPPDDMNDVSGPPPPPPH